MDVKNYEIVDGVEKLEDKKKWNKQWLTIIRH